MKFKHIFFSIFFSICFGEYAASQNFSVYAAAGLMKYQGDLDFPLYSFQEAKFCAAAGFNYQYGHLILRSDFLHGSLAGADSITSSRKQRNLSFATNITEFSLGLEYDLFDIRGHKKITPYIVGSLGIFHFNPYAFDSAGTKTYLQPLGTEGQGLSLYPKRKFYKLTQLNQILGGGFKYRLTDNFTFGVELLTRNLYTDYLDDVSTTYPDQQALLAARGPQALEFSFRAGEINSAAIYEDGKRRGNPSNKDTYYNLVFKITYTFTARSGSGFYSGKRGKSTRCPVNVH